MSTEQAIGFFREVYSDKTLQGKLHHALTVTSPEVVAQIAQAVGYEVTVEDLAIARGDGEPSQDVKNRDVAVVEYVLPHDFWFDFTRSPVWRKLDKDLLGSFDPFREAPPFHMTIPGPSWVQVMGGKGEPASDARVRPSAVELYDSL